LFRVTRRRLGFAQVEAELPEASQRYYLADGYQAGFSAVQGHRGIQGSHIGVQIV
jgi:hypothetical protein